MLLMLISMPSTPSLPHQFIIRMVLLLIPKAQPPDLPLASKVMKVQFGRIDKREDETDMPSPRVS